jgi:hypothetical protein
MSKEGILDGQRPLDSSFSSVLFSQLANQASTLGTTGGLLKEGGRAGAATGKSISPSGKSMTFSMLMNALLLHVMSQVKKNQQMTLPGASTLHVLSSSLLSQSQMSSENMLQTSTAHSHPLSSNSEPITAVSSLNQNLHKTPSGPPIITNQVRPLTVPSTHSDSMDPLRNPSTSRPSAYAPHLTPVPSPLHPHCLACDRL